VCSSDLFAQSLAAGARRLRLRTSERRRHERERSNRREHEDRAHGGSPFSGHDNCTATPAPATRIRSAPIDRIFQGVPYGDVASVSALLLSIFTLTSSPLHLELVFQGRPLEHHVHDGALEEAARIWAPYGVDVRAAAVTGPRHDDVVRLFVAFADRPKPPIAADALGSILFNGDVPQPAIVMYPKAIDDLVSTATLLGRSAAEWPPLLHELVLGRALGRALAHEIGHYLLRTRQHSPSGLMRARQPILDLVAAERQPLLLSADQIVRLADIGIVPISAPLAASARETRETPADRTGSSGRPR